MSAALFEREGRALVAHRRRGPFAGQWMLPTVLVRDDEAAEDALRRHAREQFDMGLGDESFVETVYLTDPDDQRQYVANIFRAPLAGHMRFNAEGDYDDARWMGADELEGLWMPPDLRTPLAQILTHPEALHETEWDRIGEQPATGGEGVPLAEREAPAAGDEPSPDNRAGWDAISAAYQEQYYGEADAGRLKWSFGVFEDDVHLLDDVRGKRGLVLGCGGGQDCVALELMGASAIGLDLSTRQLEYARAYALRHGAVNVSFVEGTAEDLSRFDSESFDFAISIHALGYVEDVDRVLMESARVLRAGGTLTISVPHPFDQTLSDEAPYRLERSYWGGDIDWDWTFEKISGRFRDYRRTMAQWFGAFTDAGFAVERLLEPYQGDTTDDKMRGVAVERTRLLPHVLIIKGRKR